MTMRLLGGGSSLNQVVSDMNANILEYNQEHPRLVLQGIATGTAVATSVVTITINHGLTYIPQADVYVLTTTANNYKKLPVFFDVSTAAPMAIQTYFDFTVTPTQLIISMTTSASSTYTGLRTFRYKLHRQEVAPTV